MVNISVGIVLLLLAVAHLYMLQWTIGDLQLVNSYFVEIIYKGLIVGNICMCIHYALLIVLTIVL